MHPPTNTPNQRAWVTSPTYRAAIGVIRKIREEKGLSLRAVVRKLDKPPSWLNKIELLERRLDIVEFIALAGALEVDPLTLLEAIIAARAPSES